LIDFETPRRLFKYNNAAERSTGGAARWINFRIINAFPVQPGHLGRQRMGMLFATEKLSR
jgi:hypothetical protein